MPGRRWSSGAVIALTPALSGHARVEGGLAVVSDWVHVLAASAWAGGLAFLLVALWRGGGERWTIASRSVPRFSTLAVVAIALLLVAGVVNGFYELGSWRGLWETTYGRLLVVKVALVLPILALGAFNNRVSVPRLRRGLASALERRRFLVSTGVELAIAVVVVGVTAALVAEPPAKAQLAVQGGPVSRDAFVHPFAVEVVVDPARTGSNEIHVYVLNHLTGQPAKVAEVEVSASLPAAEVGPHTARRLHRPAPATSSCLRRRSRSRVSGRFASTYDEASSTRAAPRSPFPSERTHDMKTRLLLFAPTVAASQRSRSSAPHRRTSRSTRTRCRRAASP